MSAWNLTSNSTVYKDTLKATETIDEPACGFIKPKEVGNSSAAVIIKQNNTIIQLLVKIQEDLIDCKAAIKRLEAAKTVSVNSELNNSIEELQKDLQNLKIGEPGIPKIPKLKGSLLVFKNPRKIFEEEKQNEQNQNRNSK